MDPFAVYLVGLRGQYLFRRITLVRGWSACLSRRLVHFFCSLGLSSGPPGGRLRARLKAGTPREAPTPAPTTSHRPHNSYPTPYEGRNNAESTNLQNHRRGGRTAELEPKHVLVAIQCRPHTPGTCHWLQFNAPPVGLHLAAQVRHVHSVKRRRPPQQQQLVPPATTQPAGPATPTPACEQ